MNDDHAFEEAAFVWWNLCGRAWTEEDPVKFLELTMQITKFLARKQQRIDAAFDEAQQVQQAEDTGRKSGLN